MKIMIWVGGAWEGIDTPTSGEGRWALNLAHMLALKGHEVHGIGTGKEAQLAPSWGEQEPIKNILFSHPRDICKQYDIAVIPWEWQCESIGNKWKKCPDTPTSAKLYIHPMFSWTGKGDNRCLYPPYDNHIVVIPYAFSFDQAFVFDQSVRLLPFPYYTQFSELNIDVRRQYTWTNKDIFIDEWKDDFPFHEYCSEVIKVLAQLTQKYNIYCNFISSAGFNSNRAKRFGIPNYINKIPYKTLHNGTVGLDKLKSYLEYSRLITPSPGSTSGSWDAIACGAVSLFYKDHTYGIGNEVSLENIEDMKDKIERYYADDNYYKSMIELQRNRIALNSFDESHNYFLRIVGEFLK